MFYDLCCIVLYLVRYVHYYTEYKTMHGRNNVIFVESEN